MNVSVVGSGAFGTALAIALAARMPVRLWARDPGHVEEMARLRSNPRRLPEMRFPDELEVTNDLRHALGYETVLLAIPAQTLSRFATEHADLLDGLDIVTCCKGIDLESGLGPSALLANILPGARVAVLTGPSFAADIARGLPTAMTLAAGDLETAEILQRRLSTPVLRLYRSDDRVGAELGGALKNVIAIACGAVIGAGLGDSARAALLTRGFSEIVRVAGLFGARTETLMGLSGLGDLALTCTSHMSRNYRLGHALGRGEVFDPAITVEGAATARAIRQIAGREGMDLPVCFTVADLVEGKLTVTEATERLMARPLIQE